MPDASPVVPEHHRRLPTLHSTYEEPDRYSLPTIGTKTHGLQAVTVNGRTQIGMGYLGAGKVAKLEFRPREELQRLKAETRP
jgi:hypothetical protein